jgi:hypothetical protein
MRAARLQSCRRPALLRTCVVGQLLLLRRVRLLRRRLHALLLRRRWLRCCILRQPRLLLLLLPWGAAQAAQAGQWVHAVGRCSSGDGC